MNKGENTMLFFIYMMYSFSNKTHFRPVKKSQMEKVEWVSLPYIKLVKVNSSVTWFTSVFLIL